MSEPTPADRPRRPRGAQPGNLNAFKNGRYSRRLGQAFRFTPPGDLRDTVLAAVHVAVRVELGKLPLHPTSEERAAAIHRAINRIGAAMATKNYREARSSREVFRMFHEALRPIFETPPDEPRR